MANTNIPKLDNALKKAEELVAANQALEALNTLHAIITNRRLRSAGWEPATEPIMLRYVSLCVELNKLRVLREGLYHYRMYTQSLNILSLAKVLKYLRSLPEKALEQIIAKAADGKADSKGVDDLEAEESPEFFLLATLQIKVRDEAAKSLHAAMLMCWEVYKLILDVLRFAPKIDSLYHETAQRAFEFCRAHQKPMEFKRLCDILRVHYTTLQKTTKKKTEFESFLAPENHLLTRLTQMAVAADLNLWTQCFQSAEDVISLGLHEQLQKTLAKRDAAHLELRGALLAQTATFYEKLAQMFSVCDQKLFHAAATLHRLFHVGQHKKNQTKEEQVFLSDITTLAVLSVSPFKKMNPTVVELEYQKYLASMLAHTSIPTKASMQAVIESRNIVSTASPLVQQLYYEIEGDIDCTSICFKTQELLDAMKDLSHVQSYVRFIKEIVFEKVIHHLSGIYNTLSIDFFIEKICPESFLEWSEKEALILKSLSNGTLKAHFDYSKNLLFFFEKPGCASLQPSSSGNELVYLASTLSELMPKMEVPGLSPIMTEADIKHDQVYSDAMRKLEDEEKRLVLRDQLVREHRINQEKELQAKEEARRTEEKEKQKKEELKEQSQRIAAQEHQEKKRRQEAQRFLQIEIAEQIIAEFKALSDRSVGKIVIKGRPIDEITVDHILDKTYVYEDYEKAIEEFRSKERQEKNKLYKQELRRLEHFTRAVRLEEMEVLKKKKEEWRQLDAEWQKLADSATEKLLAEQQEADANLKNFLEKRRMVVEPWIASRKAKALKRNIEKIKARNAKIKLLLKQEKIEAARQRQKQDMEKMEKERELEEKIKREAAEAEEEAARKRSALRQEQKLKEVEEKLKKDNASHRPAYSSDTRQPPRPESGREFLRDSSIDKSTLMKQDRSSDPNAYAFQRGNPPSHIRRYNAPGRSRADSRYDAHLDDTPWIDKSSSANAPRPPVTSVKPPPVADTSKSSPDNDGFTFVQHNHKAKPRK